MARSVGLLLSNAGVEYSAIGARALLESEPSAMAAIASSDLIIEFGIENLETKKSLIAKIAQISPQAIVGTGTSSLSVEDLAGFVADPALFLGIHFINPPIFQKSVEIIPNSQTSQVAIDKVKNWLATFERNSYVIPDTPGFVINSVLFAFLNQAVYTLSQTKLAPEDIDDMLKSVMGTKMGPLATLDFVGLDVAAEIIQNMHRAAPSEHLAPAPLLLEMVSEGKLGKKSGSGFF